MKRHAKASTAGSTSNAGTAPSRMRGVFALSCISLLGLVTLFALPSRAAQIHPHSTFEAGSAPSAIAVDQSAGLIYVLDSTDQVVRKFDTAGNPVDFAALGSNALNGSDAGSDNDQTPQNGFQVESFGAGNQIAVDNSGGATDGTIYLSDSLHHVVDVFDASGEYLTQLSGTGTPPGSFANATEPCGVATDPSGDLYVSTYGGQVNRYVPAADPVAEADYDDQIDGLSNPCQLAADSSGAVYTAPYGGGALSKYAASDFGQTSPAGTAVDPGPVNSVAVDPSTEDIFAARSADIAQYSSAAVLKDSFGESQLSGPKGIAVEGSSGKAFLSDSTNSVHVFGGLVAVPDVITGSASNVEETSATVSGTVDPNGIALTECEFRYSYTTPGEFGPIDHPATAPCSTDPGSGSGPVTVSAELSGLAPMQLYSFHLHAANANGEVDGEVATFNTSGIPATQTLGVYAVDEDSAILAGELDQAETTIPPGTTYRFEWGTDGTYGHSTASSAPTGGIAGVYSTELSGLQPDTTYHYRIVTTSASSAEAAGLDRTFHTLGGSNPAPQRAYEKVTPSNKGPYNATAAGAGSATSDGDHVVSELTGPIPGSAQGKLNGLQVSVRGTSGWTSQPLAPDVPASDLLAQGSTYTPSPDLTSVAIGTGVELIPGAGVGADGEANLFIRSLATDSYRLATPKVGETPNVFAASPNFSQVVYMTDTAQTADAPDGVLLPYQWENGQTKLVAVLPDGTAASTSAVIGSGSVVTQSSTPDNIGVQGGTPVHAISGDGKRIIFHTLSVPLTNRGRLYDRENGTTTVEVSASQRTPVDPAGPQPATFWDAEAEHGSAILFTSCEKLTNDSTADVEVPDANEEGGCNDPGETLLSNRTGGRDLYRYDVESGELSDLTTADPDGADVYGVIGASTDLDRIYFLAGGDLAPGAIPGRPNIYLWDHGETSFVAALRQPGSETSAGPYRADMHIAANAVNYRAGWAHVSANGRSLFFLARAPLAGYDNTHPLCEDDNRIEQAREHYPCAQGYVFDASSRSLTCVSCPTDGGPPLGEVRFSADSPFNADKSFSKSLRQDAEPTRNLSADGRRAFFETRQSLVHQDSNGRSDVYEWSEGALRLISPGNANTDAGFVDASVGGENVFIVTAQRLLGLDEDGLVDVYDARVGGGFPEAPPPEPGCEGDACQAPAQAPSDPTPASSTYEGAGNAKARGKKRRHRAKKRHPRHRHVKHTTTHKHR